MAAPALRFVGNYDVAAEGKCLWEILCQLRNLGAGRIVTKTEWQLRWPNQSSYLKIVHARPEMDPWLHKGKVWAEWTFRGRNMGVYEFSNDLNRADWKLVHKHEEHKLLDNKSTVSDIVLPSTFPLPPLQRYLSQRAAKKSGVKYDGKRDGRASLDVCLDPQFNVYKDLIKQKEPTNHSDSIYKEVDPQVYLDWYGQVLPTKVETWSLGPASYEPRWKVEKPAE
ncbi:unnamed protein product [Bursaphelenchus okinawaensis]|uniref:28S ribosomal protein S34, mitochondrial n=1 Tax=Bursaphelenchus okinawaensis TaxID=465554 RepID=A0A811LAX9_9BILA|nr:unnamed protein product [Bursaphelenchus okinawaensis]CAG9120772.1 unnamed protein product [Bursaphelenchus okinawaensis]